jgi:tetratricopeptide (TPR) repeat protein
MGGIDPWDRLLEYATFGLPVAVLATLLFLLMRRKSRKGAAAPKSNMRADVPETVAQTVLSPVAQTKVETPVAAVVADPAALERNIETALKGPDKTALAPLYLELANARGRAGDETARMAALRSAAGYGALHGPHGAHAAARLNLAEAAYQAGDLTSACEQWQLARAAYQADGQADVQDKIDKRMRENGCPTDWVLTDF